MKSLLIKAFRDRYVRLAVIVATCLLCGYGTGRYGTSRRVEYRDKLVEVEVVRTVEVIKDRVQYVGSTEQKQTVRYKRVYVKSPDGTVTTTTTNDTDEHALTNDLLKVDLDKSTTMERIVYKDRETIKTVTPARPNWSATFMPGYDLSARKMAIGGSLERRVIGPVHAGVWGSTAGVGGIVLRLEF